MQLYPYGNSRPQGVNGTSAQLGNTVLFMLNVLEENITLTYTSLKEVSEFLLYPFAFALVLDSRSRSGKDGLKFFGEFDNKVGGPVYLVS